MIKRFLGETDFASEIRTEIERCITRREPFSTSVEVPRTSACRKILLLAGEEADRLGHRSVGTEHLLLGMLRAERSLAAQILEGKGLKPADIREQLAEPAVAGNVQARQTRHALSRWCAFLAGRKWQKAEDLLPFFAMNARFVDVRGRQWNRKEIEKGFVALFAPYAKKNATHAIEQTLADSGDPPRCERDRARYSTLYSNSRRGTAWLRPMRPAAMSALK